MGYAHRQQPPGTVGINHQTMAHSAPRSAQHEGILSLFTDAGVIAQPCITQRLLVVVGNVQVS